MLTEIFPTCSCCLFIGLNLPNGAQLDSKSKFDDKIEASSAKMYFHYYGQLLHQQNMLQDYVRTSYVMNIWIAALGLVYLYYSLKYFHAMLIFHVLHILFLKFPILNAENWDYRNSSKLIYVLMYFHSDSAPHMFVLGSYYAAVIENRVDFAGQVVVDVGAGSGILSLFAAQVPCI